MFDSIMLDLETMAKSSRAAIVSIGMFKFSLDEVQEYDQVRPEQKFERHVSLASCERFGLDIDPGTIMWWFDQSDAVRSPIRGATADLKAVLMDVHGFMDSGDKPELNIWGNGATFDNVILMNAFEACGFKYPVSYKRNMCYRTLKNLVHGVGGHIEHYGTQHRALDDAISQGLALQRIMAKLRGGGL